MSLDKKFNFDKMEDVEIKTAKPTAKAFELRFITDENDGDLLTIIKKLINTNNLSYQDVYSKYGQTLGWNMINSIRKGQISWDRFKKWMDLLNMDISLTVTDKIIEDKTK